MSPAGWSAKCAMALPPWDQDGWLSSCPTLRCCRACVPDPNPPWAHAQIPESGGLQRSLGETEKKRLGGALSINGQGSGQSIICPREVKKQWKMGLCASWDSKLQVPTELFYHILVFTYKAQIQIIKIKTVALNPKYKALLSSGCCTTALITCPWSQFCLERRISFIFVRQYNVVVKSTSSDSDCQTLRPTSLTF